MSLMLPIPAVLPAAVESFQAYRYYLTDQPSDAHQILTILENIKQEYLRKPYIREFAVSLLKGLGNNDIDGQVQRITSFVKRHMIYVRDPADSEYVIAPDQLISRWRQTGRMYGDCDDHTLLLNTLLGSIGFDTKFVGVKFGPSPYYNHVISGVMIRGVLNQIDPCAKGVAQKLYTDTLIL